MGASMKRSLHLVAFVTAVFAAAPSFAAAVPTVTISPTVTPPTEIVDVSATGFGARETVDIYFDASDTALAVSNGKGAFSNIHLTVPAGAVPGKHYITAVGRRSGDAAQHAVTIQANWAQFGFNNLGHHNNFYENVVGAATVGTLDTLWSFAATDAIQSSPAVVAGVVYFGSDDGNVYAVNAANGMQLWSFTTENYVRSAPAVVDGVVYVGSEDNNLYAINAATGKQIWQFTSGGEVLSSPAVADGVVYFGSDDGNIYARDAATGAKVWTYAATTGLSNVLLANVLSSPAVVDGIVYIAASVENDNLSFSGYVFALNAKTGATIWSDSVCADVIQSSPAVADGVIYIGCNDGYLYAINGNADPPQVLWKYQTGDAITSAPAVADGVVYFTSQDKNVYAVDATSGDAVWSAPYTTGGAIFSSPAVANGVVYVGSEDNNGNDYLYGLDAANGSVLWAGINGGPFVTGSAAVANGVVFIGSEDQSIYAYSLNGAAPATAQVSPPQPKSLHPDRRLVPAT
jgi:outer membrane protein assembly factor BamB